MILLIFFYFVSLCLRHRTFIMLWFVAFSWKKDVSRSTQSEERRQTAIEFLFSQRMLIPMINEIDRVKCWIAGESSNTVSGASSLKSRSSVSQPRNNLVFTFMCLQVQWNKGLQFQPWWISIRHRSLHSTYLEGKYETWCWSSKERQYGCGCCEICTSGKLHGKIRRACTSTKLRR